MRQPKTQHDQDQGKARAELLRGSGHWPHQNRPCDLEPPWQNFDRTTLTAWDCEVNNWDTPFHLNMFGRLTPGPIIRQPGQLITLPEIDYTDDYYNLVPIVIEQFKEDEPTIALAEQLLRTLPTVTRPVSFEIMGFGPSPAHPTGQTTVQIIADRFDAATLHAQLQAHYPNSAIRLNEALTADDMLAANEVEHGGLCGTACLENSCLFPLETITRLDTDPLGVAIAAMENIEPDNWGMIQILFQPATKPFAQTMEQSITDTYEENKYIFPEINHRQFEQKFSAPLFAVSIRILAADESLATQLHGWLGQFAKPPQRFLFRQDIPPEFVPNAIGARCTYLPGILLNTAELATLVHLPAVSLTTKRLQRVTTRTRPATPLIPGQGAVLLGHNTHRGKTIKAGISSDLRPRHAYIAGASGTGKSTLLLNMIKHDLDDGRGVGLLDPHGDLVDSVLAIIPPGRRKDVVYFNPADTAHPPGFNILHSEHRAERERTALETVATIKKFFGSWGDRMDHILVHTLLTVSKDPSATLFHVRRMLVDTAFRQSVVSKLRDQTLKDFWQVEFPNYPKGVADPILNKLSPFLINKPIRNIICQRQTTFDFAHIINHQQILLANLSTGRLGKSVSGVFGTFIMSKLINATFRRAAIPEADRIPFYLYIDEFQNFVDLAIDFEQILSEARKYKLILTVANQYVGQLSDAVRQAIFGNVGSLLTFRLGVEDAKRVAHEFGDFTADEILSLERGQAIVRVGGTQTAFNLSTPRPPKLKDDDNVAAIVEHSRKRFTRPRAEVEKAFAARPSRTSEPPKAQKATFAPHTPPSKATKPAPEPEFLRPEGLDDDFVV